MLRRSVAQLLAGLRAVRPMVEDPADAAFAAMKKRAEQSTDQGIQPRADELNNLDGTTRLGGAKVLLESKLNFLSQNNDQLPFQFVRTKPSLAGLCGPICRELQRMDIKTLTELQAALVPVMLKGRHVIAHAETGSGKSFGVALAVSNRIARDVVAHRLHTVIIVPTAELALQYDRWIKHFAGAARHIVFAVSESLPLQQQLARLHNFQPHVLVGTPQGIATVMRHAVQIFGKKLRTQVDTIVLDEADIVLKMPVKVTQGRSADAAKRRLAGKLPALPETLPGKGQRRIAAADMRIATGADVVERLYRHGTEDIPAHIVALSATIDGQSANLLNSWMDNDDALRVTSSLVEHSIPSSIDFYLFSAMRQGAELDQRAVLQLVLRLIRAQHPTFKVLILTAEPISEVTAAVTDLNGDEKAKRFSVGNVTADEQNLVPGNASEPGSVLPSSAAVGKTIRRGHRNIFAVNNTVISRLSQGIDNVGIGTFEVARGLHIHGVTHVIIYGDVTTATDFVHAAGRTGRAGASGDVCVIFPPTSARRMQNIASVVGIPWFTNRLPELHEMVEAAEARDTARVESLSEHIRASALMDGNSRSDMAVARTYALWQSGAQVEEDIVVEPVVAAGAATRSLVRNTVQPSADDLFAL